MVPPRRDVGAGVNPKNLVGAKKAPLRLVPPALFIGAAEALENGAQKYGPQNWRDQPVSAVTYVEAALRHLLAYLDGEDTAPDTGIHHVKHAVAGLGILLDCLGLETLIDDRPKPGSAPKLLAELDRSDSLAMRRETVAGGPVLDAAGGAD